jgi:hypothetical protein
LNMEAGDKAVRDAVGLQVGDRVRKIGPTNGTGLEEEGRVLKVDGTKVVVESAASGRAWNRQSAANFLRLDDSAAPPARPPPAAPKAAAANPRGPARNEDVLVQVELPPAPPPAPSSAKTSDATPPRRPPHSHTERPMQKQPNAAASAPAPALDLTEYDTTFVASLAYDPKTYVIRGIEYKSGRDRNLQHTPYDRENTEAWYFEKETPFPPAAKGGFTEITVKALPRAEDDEHVRWAGERYTIKEWRQRLEDWQAKYPNLTHTDGSTCHETKSFRVTQTTNIDNIKHCFDKCKRPTWPANLSGYSRKLLESFRVDPWGNMVCLPATAGGLATDGALCFFDVDHTFPFSRGGRSVRSNFEAMQCCANRFIKSDNLVQWLNPQEMNCGISAAQLLAMVQFCENGGGGERRKDLKHMLNEIKRWLTSEPGPARGSFLSFQTDVGRSTQGSKLIEYFEDRDREDVLARRARDKTAVPTPAPRAADQDTVLHMAMACDQVPVALFPPSTKNENRNTPADENKNTPADAPRLMVRKRGPRVEVWGPATYAVKDHLKSQLHFYWDKDPARQCWFKAVSEDETERLLHSLQDLAQQKALHYMPVS